MSLSSVTAVSVYTNGTVFAIDTDITFVAVTEETGPLEFTWYFGDDAPVRTTSRSIRRRLAVARGCVRGIRAAQPAPSGGSVLPLRALCHLAPLCVVHERSVPAAALPPPGTGRRVGRWDHAATMAAESG